MIIINGANSGDAIGRWYQAYIASCPGHVWTLNSRGDGLWSCTRCPARARVR